MKNIKIPVLLAALAFSSPAFAGKFSIGALGGWNRAQISLSPTQSGMTYTAGNSFAGGVSLGLPLAPMFGIEIDGIYAQQSVSLASSFTIDASTYKIDSKMTMNHFQIPVLVRFSPISMFSVGVGLFGGIGLGDVNQTVETTVTTPDVPTEIVKAETSQTYDQAKMSTVNFGAVGSATLMFPIAPMLSAGVDGRYLMGLNNLATTGSTSTKLSNVQVLASVQLGL